MFHYVNNDVYFIIFSEIVKMCRTSLNIVMFCLWRVPTVHVFRWGYMAAKYRWYGGPWHEIFWASMIQKQIFQTFYNRFYSKKKKRTCLSWWRPKGRNIENKDLLFFLQCLTVCAGSFFFLLYALALRICPSLLRCALAFLFKDSSCRPILAWI